MSRIMDHARRELELAGLLSEDSVYGGAVGAAVLELIAKFDDQGHSGGSAHQTVDLFKRLALFEPLTPITTDPAEWREVTEQMGGTKRVWQNIRGSRYFSNDGGQTAYNVDDVKRTVFPLSPPVKR